MKNFTRFGNTHAHKTQITRTFSLTLALILGVILPGTIIFDKQINAILPSAMPTAKANNTAHVLAIGTPLTQDWSNAGLITANDNWSGVTSIEGYLGQNITTGTGVDPQTLLTTSALSGDLTVLANQSNTTITNGDVAEFDTIANPTIALQGSGTADAPYIVFYLNTTNCAAPNSASIAYNVRDIDGTSDDAIQQVALHYRIGGTGNFTNVPSGYIADATTGGTATQVTAKNVLLPNAVLGQALVEVRIMTTNAVGNDEWIGIDDINVQCNSATASVATIGGRVTTALGAGIPNSKVTLTGQSLSQPRYAFTNPFGYYSFTDIAVGADYVITVQAKGYTFGSQSQLVSAGSDVTEVNFIAQPQ